MEENPAFEWAMNIQQFCPNVLVSKDHITYCLLDKNPPFKLAFCRHSTCNRK